MSDFVTGDYVAVECMSERIVTYLLAMPEGGEAVLWVHGKPMTFAVSALLELNEQEREAICREWERSVMFAGSRKP